MYFKSRINAEMNNTSMHSKVKIAKKNTPRIKISSKSSISSE